MKGLLAQIQNAAPDASKIFGKVEVKTGPTGLYNKPVGESIATVFVFGVRIAFFIGALMVLIYMLWGAFNYITSGGDSEKAAMARGKIINAVFGILLLVIVFVLWVFFTDMLGIIEKTPNGFMFNLPTLDGSSSGAGGGSGTDPCQNTPVGKPC